MAVNPWKSTWKSTWWPTRNTALHAVHVGVPGRVPGVDAASCKSVGYTGGTGDIFTNCHLLVLHADICDIMSFRPVTTENQQSLQIWPIIKNICSVFPGWILKADFYQTLFLQLIFTKFLQVDGDGSLGNNPSASITPGNYLQVKSLFWPRTKYWK